MRRLLLLILLAVLFASAANARFQRFPNFGARTSGFVPVTQFDVYPGCTSYSVPASRKTWYFSDQTDGSTNTPAMGHTPAYYAGNNPTPVPQSQWGDINHPLYPIQNLFDFGSSPYAQAVGWTKPLDGMNIYRGPPSSAVFQSFADYNSLIAGDTSHFYLWPGDEVVLKAHAGVDVGTWNLTSAIGATSPLGKTSHGLHEIDQSGNTVYVYIHGDSSGARPWFDFINENSTQGIVLQGMNVFQSYTGYLTSKSGRFFNWSGNFTATQTINLNGYVMTFVASPVGAQDVKIGTTQQLSLINAAKNFLNSSNPLTNTVTATTQQSNFTLTQTLSTPTNGQTIAVNGVTWTFVTTITTGNQIQIISSAPADGDTVTILGTTYTWRTHPSLSTDLLIQGTVLGDTLLVTATAFKASTLPAMDLFTNYTSGATTVNYIYGPSAQPTNGTALTVNGVTWTFVTGSPTGNQIQISPTNTTATIWETLGNAMLAWDAFGANPWGSGVTTASNGSGLLTNSVGNGLSSIYEASSTRPQADSDNPVHLSTWGLGGTQGVHTSSNSVTNFAQDNIFDDILVTGWSALKQSDPASLAIDNYPTTGSLGVDPTTGIPGTPGGAWNIMDWAIQPNFTGFSFNGNQLATSGSNTAGGNSCTTLSNSKIFYVGTAYSNANMNHILVENVVTDYIGNDVNDDYSSWDTFFNYVSTWNGVQNGQAFHPDFLQVGVSGQNNGVMDNHFYNGLMLMFATDAAMQTNIPSWTNMDGTSQPIQVAFQGVNANGALHNQFTVQNSLFITPACLGVSVEVVPTGTVTLLNNTLLQPGTAATGASARCSTAPSFTPHVNPNTAVTETIDMENNVSNAVSIGTAAGLAVCPLGANVTFKHNLITQTNAGGSLSYFVSTYCPNGASPGSHLVTGSPAANMFGGGYDAAGAPAAAFTTYPTSNPTGNPNNYNLVPLPAGPLAGTGQVNSLLSNVLGQPRNQPPNNIGAY